MNERIVGFVDGLLSGCSSEAEMHDELLGNLTERYMELLAEGCTEEEAYKRVRESVGDPTELRGQDRDLPLAAPSRERQNRAFRSMAAIILIVCSIMPVIMIRNRFGPALMFLMVATGIGLLVYNSVIKPTYHKPESPDCGYLPGGAEYGAKTGSHVEDTGKKRRSFELHIILWTLILAIYFVYSFISGAWYISWVIFLVGAAVDRAVALLVERGDEQS